MSTNMSLLSTQIDTLINTSSDDLDNSPIKDKNDSNEKISIEYKYVFLFFFSTDFFILILIKKAD